jgi:ribosomal protein S18 acetylase RimI-like enzyme
MNISNSLSRLRDYQVRNGLWATIRRAELAGRRALFSGKSVLFYCDLADLSASPANLPGFFGVERKTSAAELSPDDLHAMTSFWSPKLARRNLKARFALGASLWLIKSNNKLAGYGWTLQGRTVEPHFFPLGKNDLHLFDFHVFPQYRGQGMNPLLVTHILKNLAREVSGRAFIEAAEWNKAQLSSLTKTPFRHLGHASKRAFFGRNIVFWGAVSSLRDSRTREA